MITINGKDSAGNYSYIQVSRESNTIHIYSPEEGSDVIFTVKQARQLVNAINECIKNSQNRTADKTRIFGKK